MVGNYSLKKLKTIIYKEVSTRVLILSYSSFINSRFNYYNFIEYFISQHGNNKALTTSKIINKIISNPSSNDMQHMNSRGHSQGSC